MEKERLFELIRKEEVLLFAGAGFSMYVGYPSGKDLAKTMHANLTTSQQNEIQLTSDLLQVTEDIYNLKNCTKNYLIEILKKEFQKEPTSIETHKILAKIPQIKTIITTNYDNLFESTNKKLQVIRRSIHPFYDGNGRTGRIINILYLVKEDLLNLPILYLSRYINQNKADYYLLLQQTRETQEWEPWILFMLEAVEQTSIQTTAIIRGIKKLMMDYKKEIREKLPKIYSQDLINNLFKHPYTKIDFIVEDLGITRQTASKYLDQLIELKLITLHKIGKENFYINIALYDFLQNAPQRLKFK